MRVRIPPPASSRSGTVVPGVPTRTPTKRRIRYRYYRKQPLSEGEIRGLQERLGVPARAILRSRSKRFRKLGFYGEESCETLIPLLATHPRLLRWPIVSPGGGAGRLAEGGARPGPDAVIGRWEGAWVEEWTSTDLPPGLRLPDAVRAPGTLTIEAVADGPASGAWDAMDPESGQASLAAAGSSPRSQVPAGRRAAGSSRTMAPRSSPPRISDPAARSSRKSRSTGDWVPGPAEACFWRRRLFRCRDAESEAAWTVEARWTFYGRRIPGNRDRLPS